MSLLNPPHLASVAHVTVQSPDLAATVGRATAFCFVDHADDTGAGYFYVVTCAHIFKDMPSNAQTAVRFNTPTGLLNMIAVYKDWATYTADDIAVLRLDETFLQEQGGEIWPWNQEHMVTRENAGENDIIEGREVFILGYPIGWRPAALDYPIVRGGMIGQIRGWIDGHHSSILVSGTVFQGNSGSPVLLYPQQQPQSSPESPEVHLLGMISNYKLAPSGENSGIADVVPIDTIYGYIEAHTMSDRAPQWTVKQTTYAVTANGADLGLNCEITVPTR